MRALGSLLIACAALAIIRAAVAMLAVIFGISLIWAICRYPRELFGFLAYCTAMSIARTYPVFTLCILATLVVTYSLDQHAQAARTP